MECDAEVWEIDAIGLIHNQVGYFVFACDTNSKTSSLSLTY